MTDAKKQSDGTNGQYEKVEKGLEICTESTEYGGCITCPYHEDYYPNACRYVNKKDALALIRQQQARIAELEAAQTARVLKLRELYEGQVIWFEGFRSEGYRSLWVAEVSKVCSDEIVFFGGNNEVHMPIHAYEERYRCWTQRPTFKQREVTRWK